MSPHDRGWRVSLPPPPPRPWRSMAIVLAIALAYGYTGAQDYADSQADRATTTGRCAAPSTAPTTKRSIT